MRDYVVSINDGPPVPVSQLPLWLLHNILKFGVKTIGLNPGITPLAIQERVQLELNIRGMGLGECQ